MVPYLYTSNRRILVKHNISYHVYADDTQIYIDFSPSQDESVKAIRCLESCINDIRLWMRRNFLKLNEEKTEFLLFGSCHQLAKINIPFISIGNVQVRPSTHARNLGVIFDSNMSMKRHISKITSSAAFHLRGIYKLRNYLNDKATEQIVHSFITSRLDMGNSLLLGLPHEQIHRLQLIQNSAARIVTHSHKHCHIHPVLKNLHWLPVKYRIMYKILLIVYKSLKGHGPMYISDLLHIYVPSRNLRSSSQFLLSEIKSKHSWGDRSFIVSAPRLWNQLPLKIRKTSTLSNFKKSIKSHSMTKAFI